MAKRKREAADEPQSERLPKGQGQGQKSNSNKTKGESKSKSKGKGKSKGGTQLPQTAQVQALAHRNGPVAVAVAASGGSNAADREAATATALASGDAITVQVITGSYERVLHGFTAAIPRLLVTTHDHTTTHDTPEVDFSDTFLFNAHASAIRCLALTPPTNESSKVTLATGSTDERINLYSLSTAPPALSKIKSTLPVLHGASIAENSKNKELGSLLHHSATVTALYFPSRSKLLSAGEDSAVTITRTRDWAPLSTIKAPIPKPQGRPSGDTAAPGEVPSGINDFAVHPSMKLMVSVGKGEKCMRLWNLVTGKKAGVLSFSREILESVGEGRFGSGEGRRVVWDPEGEEFAVAFERGVVIFGIDCKPKIKILPTPRTKVHQMHYLPANSHAGTLLVATEDGRIMVYNTNATTEAASSSDKNDDVPTSALVAQLGGPAAGISGRVKDFELVQIPDVPSTFLVVTGSSDGAIRLWSLETAKLKANTQPDKIDDFTSKQVGRLLGNYSTGTRITCLKAFVMTGSAEEAEEEEQRFPEENGEISTDDDSE